MKTNYNLKILLGFDPFIRLYRSVYINHRYYSASSYPFIIPAVTYSNADIDKFQIINENRNKVGVYR